MAIRMGEVVYVKATGHPVFVMNLIEAVGKSYPAQAEVRINDSDAGFVVKRFTCMELETGEERLERELRERDHFQALAKKLSTQSAAEALPGGENEIIN